jgi:hypothetical protein
MLYANGDMLYLRGTESKFLVPDWGIESTPAGLSYRPTRLHRLAAGRYHYPMPESTISPSQELRIWLQAVLVYEINGLSDFAYIVLITDLRYRYSKTV